MIFAMQPNGPVVLSCIERFRHSGSVATRRIAGELLLVPIKTEPQQKTGIYTLNGTAAMLWDLLDGTRTLEQLVERVAAEFQVDPAMVRRDTSIFIRDLLSFQAVEEVVTK